MLSDLQVRQLRASEQGALFSFLRKAYPDEPLKSDPAFWKWHFLENPFVAHDNLPTWVVVDGDEIVGQLAAIPIELKIGEIEQRAMWVVNIVVLPEYRRRGLGHRLFQMARDTFCSTMIALGYNEGSGAILNRLQWFEMGRINRYHKLLFPGDADSKLSGMGVIRDLVNLAFAPLRPGMAKLAITEGEIREVARFDLDFDELWRAARSGWPCAVVRGSRFLEWQYMRQPGKKFDVLGYYDAGRLLGYVVLFFRKPARGTISHKAAITDMCYAAENSETIIDNLLKAALRLALERRAGGLVTDVLDDRVEQRLRKFGFHPVKSSPGFMVAPGEHQAIMSRRENWFLTRGDSDVSIFEDPNI
jgi:GNAT superfamily N-acetyltransferase